MKKIFIDHPPLPHRPQRVPSSYFFVAYSSCFAGPFWQREHIHRCPPPLLFLLPPRASLWSPWLRDRLGGFQANDPRVD